VKDWFNDSSKFAVPCVRGEGGCGGQMVKQAIVMVAVLELQDGDFPTALYVIFSPFTRIVPAVLVVKARVWKILGMHLLF
jgi:hypothetical protein